ncbi:DNA-directed DNA polymerase [Tanacetum coccineum]
MLDQHRNGMHEQFSQILATIGKSQTPMPKPDAPNFAITTRSGTTTHDPIYPTSPSLTTVDNTKRTIEEEGAEGEEKTTIQGKETPQSPTLYHPSKSSSVPFLSRLMKQKNDDDDERLLSIFRQIHINLPFLEAMIHMRNGDKLSEECSAVIQRSLPQKEGDPGSFILPCISELKPTRMSIQLADRSVKYPIGVCENLLVKINKFIFLVNFVVLEMDEDDLVLIILGRPFLATARVVIDILKGKLNHTAKLVHEQWVDTVDHNGKWIETEEEDNPE